MPLPELTTRHSSGLVMSYDSFVPNRNTHLMTENVDVSVEQLSFQQIEELIPALQEQLKEQDITVSIEEKYTEQWAGIESSMREQFAKSLENQKNKHYAKTAFNVVLNNHIGEENTDLFFSALNVCIEDGSFKPVSRFYSKVPDSDVRAAGRVSFAYYRKLANKIDNCEFARVMAETKKNGGKITHSIMDAYDQIFN